MKHVHVDYDAEGDIFARRSEKNDKLAGYARFNVLNRHLLREVRVALPA